MEAQAARDSGMVVVSRTDGIVTHVDAERVKVRVTGPNGEDVPPGEPQNLEYILQKYQRSNQDTCLNQRPLVYEGEDVVPGASTC